MNSLIDYEFCRTSHGFGSDAEVRQWFAQLSPPDFRTFSRDFSPIDYLLDNGDVSKAGVHPVTHYLNYGHVEGRPSKPIKIFREYELVKGASRAMAPADARVAIVLHIYYPSFIPYFIARLKAMEGLRWDLFISAPAEVIRDHEGTLRAAFGDRVRSLKAVPNRGRNFAPLFVDFASELIGYDAICHCHSKESLHSGRRQIEWADYLISSLIGAPDVMRRHLNLILSGDCDVISAVPFVGMPPWASHSLSNDAQFTVLCERLALDGSTGFMSYPVGGMLWMSQSVFATVASLGLTHADFPAEPSRPDGELHHALERLLGRIAGRRLAYYDQVAARYYASDAVLRAEVSRGCNVDDLCEIIRDHDIVTFDFFDTLCVRSTGDEEWAKRRVGFVLGQDYRTARNSVEAQLRSELGAGQDVPLSLVAQALAAQNFPDAAEAVALERAFDFATLVPRRQIVHAYEHAIKTKKQVFIVSDGYYDQGFILSFLRKHKIAAPEEVFVSGDVGLRKDRGDLWRHLAQRRGRKRALHIGDNVHSDIQKASEHGFATFYIAHWREELLPFSGFSKKLLKRNLNNLGFARSIDRSALENADNDLQERDMDAGSRPVSKRRRRSKNRDA